MLLPSPRPPNQLLQGPDLFRLHIFADREGHSCCSTRDPLFFVPLLLCVHIIVSFPFRLVRRGHDGLQLSPGKPARIRVTREEAAIGSSGIHPDQSYIEVQSDNGPKVLHHVALEKADHGNRGHLTDRICAGAEQGIVFFVCILERLDPWPPGRSRRYRTLCSGQTG